MKHSITIDCSVIPATDCIKILVLSLDSVLNLNKHIKRSLWRLLYTTHNNIVHNLSNNDAFQLDKRIVGFIHNALIHNVCALEHIKWYFALYKCIIIIIIIILIKYVDYCYQQNCIPLILPLPLISAICVTNML